MDVGGGKKKIKGSLNKGKNKVCGGEYVTGKCFSLYLPLTYTSALTLKLRGVEGRRC